MIKCNLGKSSLAVLLVCIIMLIVDCLIGYLYIKSKDIIILILAIVLGATCILLITKSIIDMVIASQMKKLLLDKKAYKTKANFVEAKMIKQYIGVLKNNEFDIQEFGLITYTYKDKKGEEHRAKSNKLFTQKETKFLEQQQKFDILCKGAISVIVEQFPKEKDK